MRIYTEDLSDFKPWGQAIETMDKIKAEGQEEELEFFIECNFDDGISFTELNDLLAYESEYILHHCGIRTDDDEAEIESIINSACELYQTAQTDENEEYTIEDAIQDAIDDSYDFEEIPDADEAREKIEARVKMRLFPEV